MARYNVRDVIQAISIENLAPNEYLVGDVGNQFRVFPGDPITPVLPTRTPVADNAVGDGRAYPKQGKPYYFNGITFPYGMALNSTMGQRMFRNWLGGPISNTVNAGPGTTDQVIQMLDPGSVPAVVNLLRKLGGEAFLYGDAFVQTIEIAQQKAGEPRISGNWGNPGHNAKLASTAIDIADIDTLDPYLKYHGAKTSLVFSDGTTTFDYASQGRLIDVRFSGNQNVVVDQLPGDGFLDPANECYGAVSKNFFIDVQSAEITGRVYMDANFSEFDSWAANKKLTSVTLLFKSCEKIGLTTHVSEVEVKFPVGEFNLAGDQDGNFSAYSFTINAIEGDPTTGSLVIGRVRRVTGALIDELAP
jgi:hypothetical protein